MSRDIKKIQIFLVTKNEKGMDEYLELRDFIGGINQRLQRSYHLKIDLITIEDPNVPQWKHEEYRKQICESEAVFFLVHTTVEEFIRLDFDAAFRQFKETGKPVIYTYFHEVEGDKERSNFMKSLDEEGYFYSFYDHVDAIKLKLLMQLKISDLDMAEMSFEKSKLVMDGREVMPLDNVKMVVDNSSLKHWNNELKKIEGEYYFLKAEYTKNKSNATLCKRYADIAAKRSSILKEIENIEKELFKQSLNFTKDIVRCEITLRQSVASGLLKEGDLDGANAVLNPEEIESDFQRKMELIKREMELIKHKSKLFATIYINELKSKIDILEMMTEYENRINDMVKYYERIMTVAFEYDVEYNAVCQYADFLNDYGHSAKAYEVIKKLEDIYNRESVSEYDTAMFYDAAGNITSNIPGMHKKTEEYYKKAIDIYERLVEKRNLDRYKSNLATSYSNVGYFYNAQGQNKKAEEYYLKAIAIREKLAKKNSNHYGFDLAYSYNNAGAFYDEQGESKKAEEYYTKATAIKERLIEKDPDRYEFDLAIRFDRIGNFYHRCGQSEKAERYYTKAIAMLEKLTERTPDRYEADLIASYDNAGVFYKNQGQRSKAEENYMKAIAIREKLAEKDPDRYGPDLARSYFNYGKFTDDEKYFEKARIIAEKHPQNYRCRTILNYLKK